MMVHVWKRGWICSVVRVCWSSAGARIQTYRMQRRYVINMCSSVELRVHRTECLHYVLIGDALMP